MGAATLPEHPRFVEYLSGGSYVRARSESRLRRTTEALLGSKRSQEPQAHNLLFQFR